MRNVFFTLAIAGLVITAVGCRKIQDEAAAAKTGPDQVSTADMKMPEDDIHKGVGGAEGTDEDLVKLKEVRDKAKFAFDKAPKDTKAKASYVEATVQLATATMNKASLPPKEKYPEALRLYREAIALDPENKEALENKKMIEDIYESMGRPIPS